MRFHQSIQLLICIATLAACEQSSEPMDRSGQVPVLSATESTVDLGSYNVHFNALATDQLAPEIASNYGIVRSRNRAMLNVSVLRKRDNGPDVAVRADIEATVTNLSGQLKSMTVREISEGDAVYYIGEVSVSNAETLVFSLDVTPEGDGEAHTIRFMKQFFVD